MTRLILVAWVFVVWTELATVPPGRRDLLVLTPSQRFTFSTFEECRDVRDLFLLLLKPNERVSGCDEQT